MARTGDKRAIEVEREVKVRLAGDAGPDLEGAVPGTVLTALPAQRLVATYFDTPDFRLFRRGVTFRHRTGEGRRSWTVKLPGGSGQLLERGEMRFIGTAGRPPEDALAVVAGLTAGAPLDPIATIRTIRRRAHLVATTGEVLAEVDDDVVDGTRRGERVAHFRELEIELAKGVDAGTIAPLLERLTAAGADMGPHPSKVGSVLGAGLTSPSSPRLRLRKRSTGRQVVLASIASATERLLAHDPFLRAGHDDPEHVHQARVAARRLRSDLRTLGSMVDRGWVSATGEDLRWVGRTFGVVRDLDVRVPRIEAAVSRLAEADRPAGRAVACRVDQERFEARQGLHEVLESDRYLALSARLQAAVDEPPTGVGADEDAGPRLRRRVARAARKLEADVRGLPKHPTDTALHQVRIRAKRLRYAAELSSPTLGPRVAAVGRASAALQAVLGELNDTAVNIVHLRSLAEAEGGIEAYAAGLLVAQEVAEQEAWRSQWRPAWKELRHAMRRARL